MLDPRIIFEYTDHQCHVFIEKLLGTHARTHTHLWLLDGSSFKCGDAISEFDGELAEYSLSTRPAAVGYTCLIVSCVGELSMVPSKRAPSGRDKRSCNCCFSILLAPGVSGKSFAFEGLRLAAAETLGDFPFNFDDIFD